MMFKRGRLIGREAEVLGLNKALKKAEERLECTVAGKTQSVILQGIVIDLAKVYSEQKLLGIKSCSMDVLGFWLIQRSVAVAWSRHDIEFWMITSLVMFVLPMRAKIGRQLGLVEKFFPALFSVSGQPPPTISQTF